MTWKNGTLSDLVFFQRGFDITKAQQQDGRVPVISSSGVQSYHSEAKVTGPGVIIGRKGTLGSVHYSDTDYWPHDTTLWSRDFRGNDTKFVYYFLKTLNLQKFDTGNSNPTLNRNHIHLINIRFPDVETQQRIASELAIYDSLIANNTRRIALLERSARLLFEEWFVRLHYPGHEHVKIVDGLPEGWERRQLGDLADITFGQSPKSEFYNQDGIGVPFHQGVADFGTRFVTDRVYCTAAGKTGNPGDILFSVRAPVGRINLTRNKIVLGRGLAAIASKEGKQNFLCYALKQTFFRDDLMGSGAIFAAITSKDLRSVLVTMPTALFVDEFQRMAEPIDRQVRVLSDAIVQTTRARDLLLPRLMDGRIEV